MPYNPALVKQVAQKYGIPVPIFQKLIQAESGGNVRAVSPAGAQGLTQLMPATAKGLGVTNPFDPMQNLTGGAKYLRQQLDAFGGDMRKALAAYNAGPGAVTKYGGVPPYKETQAYVQKILGGGGLPASQPTAGRGPTSNPGLTSSPQDSPDLTGILSSLMQSNAEIAGVASPTIKPPDPPQDLPGPDPQYPLERPEKASKAKQGKVKGLLPDFERRLSALIAAVRAQGGKLEMISGFRSVEHQQQLWNAALQKYGSAAAARKWVAPPGRSKHGEGIAADLRGDLELAARLAPKFGLYRPLGHEPWHFEPVGSRG